jgi:hypothetical protein
MLYEARNDWDIMRQEMPSIICIRLAPDLLFGAILVQLN